MKTAIATFDPRVSVTPAPNDRVLVTLEGRGWTLIEAFLTQDEAVALNAALTSYGLSTSHEFHVSDVA